ncbi:NADPH:quinone reductase-like Zn-dependent oxidoreductase [Herbihabitans rhizosphaerae]|uniref:NADPH:quinone reductase-like Zn-dependent oxidoreductase n=1 Tax=Herbihabitans rhizosphaerae TaxID=1872711 RepID=A0A4V2ESC5_9PSEU|nr:NADP-dependent oxidoreductase [Herbihabitans rhizosphaerae]RZS37093.1 NADPH:quinone reductase-like Zn-dependent oxidoreductase [Herbihabitans rhizosphaerae]
MRAINQQVLGGPEVLELVEVDPPVPADGEVLVRVRAAGVNPADWKLRSGVVDRIGPPPFRLGLEFSGVVEGTGEEVFALWLSRAGAYAEYVAVPGEALARKPSSVDHTHAAALPGAALTAWQALAGVAGVHSGQRVLVHAAAGGVGHLAVQIAKARGAYVIGTARADKHEFVRSLGADEVVDYTAVDFTEAIDPVDVAYDLVGGDYGSRSLSIVDSGGVLLDAVGDDAEGGGDPRYRRFYVSPSGADLAEIAALVDAGTLRVHVEQTLDLADAAKAHQLSESGRVRGKIVLTV